MKERPVQQALTSVSFMWDWDLLWDCEREKLVLQVLYSVLLYVVLCCGTVIAVCGSYG